jgi:hypothetical protein
MFPFGTVSIVFWYQSAVGIQLHLLFANILSKGSFQLHSFDVVCMHRVSWYYEIRDLGISFRITLYW